ncbi:MAG: TIGR02117 family protein [Candidatus Thiodiazotropha sp.]
MQTTIMTWLVGATAERATLLRAIAQSPVLIFLVAITGCSDNPKIVQHVEDYSGLGQHQVHVVSHAWHTGFVIPSEKVYETIPALQERFGRSANIEFGWGDKQFYQAKEITLGLKLRAILWPTETVVHAVGVAENVQGYFANSQIVPLCLTDKALSSLMEFISNSFSKNRLGEVEALTEGIYGDSQFYKGAGNYHLFNTCNEWTAKGLKSIGMDLFPGTKLTAESIMSYLSGVESGSASECTADFN